MTRGTKVKAWFVPRQKSDWNPHASGAMCKVDHHLVIGRSCSETRPIGIQVHRRQLNKVFHHLVIACSCRECLGNFMPIGEVSGAPRCPLPNSGSPVSAFCIFLMWETFSGRRGKTRKLNSVLMCVLIHLPTDWPWQRSWGTQVRTDGLLRGL